MKSKYNEQVGFSRLHRSSTPLVSLFLVISYSLAAFTTRSVHWSPDLVKEITVPRKEPLYSRADLARVKETLLASPTTVDVATGTGAHFGFVEE